MKQICTRGMSEKLARGFRGNSVERAKSSDSGKGLPVRVDMKQICTRGSDSDL
jgi:hypothetical protein